MSAEAQPDELDDEKMPLMAHLVELRRRVIWAVVAFFVAFIVCFYFANYIFDFLEQPLASTWQGQEGRKLIFTALQEKFFVNVKVAMFGGFVLAFPMIAFQLWRFVAPGLYKNEKNAFLPFLIAAPFMFLLGASFVYYGLLPNAIRFFTSFEEVAKGDALAITAELKVSEYLSLVMQLILSFGVAFEMPVVLTLMIRAGIITVDSLVRVRKYAFLGVTILAAILTPPDPGSMLALAIPLVALFEVSIIIGRMIDAGRKKREAAEEAAEKAAADNNLVP